MCSVYQIGNIENTLYVDVFKNDVTALKFND